MISPFTFPRFHGRKRGGRSTSDNKHDPEYAETDGNGDTYDQEPELEEVKEGDIFPDTSSGPGSPDRLPTLSAGGSHWPSPAPASVPDPARVAPDPGPAGAMKRVKKYRNDRFFSRAMSSKKRSRMSAMNAIREV